jgi:hypothetical protein
MSRKMRREGERKRTYTLLAFVNKSIFTTKRLPNGLYASYFNEIEANS